MRRETLDGLVMFVLAAGLVTTTKPGRSQDAFPVHIEVDARTDLGEFREIWRFFGADEPNYAYMPHGRELIGQLGELRPGRVFFRAHNLLTTGDGTPAFKWGSTNIYTEDSNGDPVYDWTIVDRIFDTYLKSGVRPYAQIGFMPEALSSSRSPISIAGEWARRTKRSTRAGRTLRTITTNGANSFISG